MKFSLIIILSLISIVYLSAQSIRTEIRNIADAIAKEKLLHFEYIGIGGRTSDLYNNFLELRDKATFDELLILENDTNYVLKAYACWALIDKKYSKIPELFIKSLNDNNKILSLNGCTGYVGELSKLLYKRISYCTLTPCYPLLYNPFYIDKLLIIDSIVLYTNKSTALLDYSLMNNNGNPKNYKRIRSIAQNSKNEYALIELAKYKNKNDIQFLIEQEEKSFYPISFFTDEAFWTFLLKYRKINKSYYYFLALASFKSENSTQVLNELLDSCNIHQTQNLAIAIIQNYTKLYENIVFKIWEKNKVIDYSILEKLYKECPNKLSTSLTIGLLSKDKLNLITDYSQDSIIPLMLHVVSKYNQDQLVNICKVNVQNTQFLELEQFLNFVQFNNIKETTSELLERLKGKNEAFEMFHLSKTLLSFKNSKTNSTLKAILKIKKKDWDEGNWTRAFEELFEEYNIRI